MTKTKPVILTPYQLRELTGCSIKKKQIEQLRAMGVPFIMNTAGKLVVTADAAAVAGSHE